MNATNSINVRPKRPNVIALNQSDVDRDSVGRIVWWDLNGDVAHWALCDALAAAFTTDPPKPPKPPSATVAVHRAAEAVARATKRDAHTTKRGHWAIVAKKPEEVGGTLVYPVGAKAWVEGDALVTENDDNGSLRRAFEAAQHTLAPTDIGTWLCDKLVALGAVPLRDRGGVYFVPKDRASRFDGVVTALKACSSHKIHVIPAMRSDDAIEAILSAIETETLNSCREIDEEIADGKLGVRGLKSRGDKTRELLERAEQYEGILGKRLDGLRDAIARAEKSVAAAILTAGATEDA